MTIQEEQLHQLRQRVIVLEKALLHIVNSLDDTKQKSLREKIKANTNTKNHEKKSK